MVVLGGGILCEPFAGSHTPLWRSAPYSTGHDTIDGQTRHCRWTDTALKMVPTRPSMEVCTLPNRTWHYRWTLSSAHAPIYWGQNLFQLDTTLKMDPVVCTRAHLLRPEPFPIGHDTIDEPYRAHTRPLLRPEPCPTGHDTIDGPFHTIDGLYRFFLWGTSSRSPARTPAPSWRYPPLLGPYSRTIPRVLWWV